MDPVPGAARRRKCRSARPLARLLDLRRAPPCLSRRARSLLAFRGRRSRHPAGPTVGRGARQFAWHRVDDVVRRRAAEHRGGLRAPVGARDAGWRGRGMGARGGRAPVADVGGALARGATSCRSAPRARCPSRRRSRDLPADVSRGSDRLARVRAHRRDPSADLLRLRRPCRVVAPHGRRREGGTHGGRLVSAGEARRDESGARRGPS